MTTYDSKDSRNLILLTNCEIYTKDPTIAGCNNILIDGNKISDIFYAPPGKHTVPERCIEIDCFRNLVIPGINDAHIHLLSSAAVMNQHSMHSIHSKDYEMIAKTLTSIKTKHNQSEWIGAYGLDDRFFLDQSFDSQWLDKFAVNEPVFISNETGHAIILNSKAMQMLHISQNDDSLLHGVIDVAENGQLTGKFFDLNSAIFHKINAFTNQFNADNNLPKLFTQLHQKGITSVQDAGHNNKIDKLQRLSLITDVNAIRIGLMIGCNIQNINDLASIHQEIDTNMVKFIGLKIMLSEATGDYLPAKSELEHLVKLSNSKNFRVAVHAVEEQAIDMTLDAFSSAHKFYPDIINRIEHCSEYTDSVIEKAKTIPFYSVTQPGFILHRGDYYIEAHPKDKHNDLYPLRTMQETSHVLAFSSDSPVIPPDPWDGFISAQSRNTLRGNRLGTSNERLTFDEIVDCYTTNGAIVEGSQDIKGTLAVGLLADLAILDASCIGSSNPTLLTILNGNIVWDSEALVLTLH